MNRRHHWPNQWIFILAAIGSAAGIGNLWRFPALAYEHGGAAFVLAIVLANILIGIPLLALEIGLGQKFQKGAPDALKAVKSGFRYIGWIAIVLSFFVLSYYMVVVSLGLNYFVSSLTLAWGSDTESYFFNKILQLAPAVGKIDGISWPALWGLLIAWIIIYFTVWKGVKSVSKVVVWSATLPFLMLAILAVRALTLEGAAEGLRLFLVPDFSTWAQPQLWLDAFSQVFFSLSLAGGMMIAYGSFKQTSSEITKGLLYVAGGNFLVSLLSGLVVFGTLGHMAFQEGVAFSEVVQGGPSLTFVVFPQAINLLPGMRSVMGILFFATFFTLAIDSAFSAFEAIAVPFKDRISRISTPKLALIISVIGFAAGIVFTTDIGFYLLDILDHFIVSYGLVLIGICEAVIVGWCWRGNPLKAFIEERSDVKFGFWWDASIRFIIPVFLVVLLVLNVIGEFQTPYGGYPIWALFFVGALPLLLSPLIAFILDRLTTG